MTFRTTTRSVCRTAASGGPAIHCGPPRGEAAARPLTRGFLTGIRCLVTLFLLTACGGGVLTRLAIDRAESYRSETWSLNGTEGTVTLAVDNGNKKSLTFECVRFDVLLNGNRIGVVRLRSEVTVPSGYSQTTVPISIRYGRESVRGLLELVLPGQNGRRAKKIELRIQGSLSYRLAGSSRTQNVRFDRQLDDRTMGYLRNLGGGLF